MGKRFCLLTLALLIFASSRSVGQTDRKDSVLPNGLNLPHLFEPSPHSPSFPGTHVVPPPVKSPINPPVGIRFPVVVHAAGMIFSGTVKRIERRPATSGHAVETVAITFHVDSAIRGVTAGEELTISQWIGLWSSGQRYRVGERLLLFLYPPSKLGLTSAIAGPIGRIQLDAQGRAVLSAQHLAAFRQDPVLGGKSRLRLSDFALAVRRASEEE